MMSGPVAILCSGQGAQHAGMFDLVAQAPEARPILDVAREFLGGVEPARFVREVDEETLFSNRAGQCLCCTQALAAWAVIRPHLPGAVVLAGYSVGELAVWGCAGLLEPPELLRLALARAEVMDESSGGDTGLVAIIGLHRGRIDELCRTHTAHVAIVNGEDFFVLGGARDGLTTLLDDARRAGATTVTLLRVAVASHTPLLAEASRRFAEALAGTPWPCGLPAGIRLLSGVDGDAVLDPAAGARKLAAQISQTVRWDACLDACRAAGTETVLELGPGRALAAMARQALPQARVRSMDDFRTPAGVLDWLRRS